MTFNPVSSVSFSSAFGNNVLWNTAASTKYFFNKSSFNENYILKLETYMFI